MGWATRLAILFLGLVFLGSGLWFLGAVCFAYLVLASRHKKGKVSVPGALPSRSPGLRYVAAAALAIYSVAALFSGGVLSPAVFVALAVLVAFWPSLPMGPLLSKTVAVDGTILLRSKFVPFVWHSVAEVKPGAGDLARALSSYEGRLTILRTGVVYAHARALALDARSAEASVTSQFRRAASAVQPGEAYLLPLDCEEASEAFKKKLSPVRSSADALRGPLPDLLVLDSSGSFVSRTGAYAAAPGNSTVIPTSNRASKDPTLTWEALERLGKRLTWSEPDSYSNFLESLRATHREPLAERFAGLEGSEGNVKVRALGGEEVQLTRAQVRAILSIYA